MFGEDEQAQRAELRLPGGFGGRIKQAEPSGIARIDERGVTFASHLDGSKHLLTPEVSIGIQEVLGSDIIMAFDECTPYPASRELARRGVENSLAWLERCVAAHGSSTQALFPIVQGSVYPELRAECAQLRMERDLLSRAAAFFAQENVLPR